MSDGMLQSIKTDAEVEGMGYVLYKSWHETYTGLIDPSYLAGITLERGVKIAYTQKEKALIAVEKDRVIGFVGFGPYRDQKNSNMGEVYAIYVLKEYHNKKVGYHLMNAALEKLRHYHKIALWVLKDNQKAIHFYEKYGFRFDGTEKKVMLGTENTELRMIYEKG